MSHGTGEGEQRHCDRTRNLEKETSSTTSSERVQLIVVGMVRIGATVQVPQNKLETKRRKSAGFSWLLVERRCCSVPPSRFTHARLSLPRASNTVTLWRPQTCKQGPGRVTSFWIPVTNVSWQTRVGTNQCSCCCMEVLFHGRSSHAAGTALFQSVGQTLLEPRCGSNEEELINRNLTTMVFSSDEFHLRRSHEGAPQAIKYRPCLWIALSDLSTSVLWKRSHQPDQHPLSTRAKTAKMRRCSRADKFIFHADSLKSADNKNLSPPYSGV